MKNQMYPKFWPHSDSFKTDHEEIVFTVEQQTVVIIERFGKFARLARAGLQFKTPFVEQKAGKLSMRIQQLDDKLEDYMC